MKIVPGSMGHHYMARVSIFLITVALIVGMVGCGPTPEYDLSITSTAGGNVTTPGETTFTYKEGTKVNLTATPDAGYLFIGWTGDVGTIADVNAANTTITISGNYSIMANFVVAYSLTISSTSGGSVTNPGKGTFNYGTGTVVNLVAEAGESGCFYSWTGDVGTIADVYAANTTITMNDNYSIMANFGMCNYYINASLMLRHQLNDDGSISSEGKLLAYSVVADGASQQQLVISDKLPISTSFGSVQIQPSGCATYLYNQSTGDLSIDIDFSQAPPSPSNEIYVGFQDVQIPGFEEPAILVQSPMFSRVFQEVPGDRVEITSRTQFQVGTTEELVSTQIFIIVGDLGGDDRVSLLSYSPEAYDVFSPYANEVDWIYPASANVSPQHEAVFDVNKAGTSISGQNFLFADYHGMLIRAGDYTVTSSDPLDCFCTYHTTGFGYYNSWSYTFGTSP